MAFGKERKKANILKIYDGCGVDHFPCEGTCKEANGKNCSFKVRIKLTVDKKGLKREEFNE